MTQQGKEREGEVKYKACEHCWEECKREVDRMKIEVFSAKEKQRDAEERLGKHLEGIDWVWVVRWTTPGPRTFECEATHAHLRVCDSREDALALVRKIREAMGKIREEANKHFGPCVGGGSDENPEVCGEYVDFGGGYSVAIQCRALNHSPCAYGRVFDIDGNELKEDK